MRTNLFEKLAEDVQEDDQVREALIGMFLFGLFAGVIAGVTILMVVLSFGSS